MRLEIYDAREATISPYDSKQLSKITNKEPIPPGLLLASKHFHEEFLPSYKSQAWPTILFPPSKQDEYQPCPKLLGLLDTPFPDDDHLPYLTIVISSLSGGAIESEMENFKMVLDDVLFSGGSEEAL